MVGVKTEMISVKKINNDVSVIKTKSGCICNKSKRASTAADPLLTNPLNSDTKLQIGAT